MIRESDLSQEELSQTLLTLADDLTFTPQQGNERTYYHIKQPSRSRFFRIGWAEYVLISHLDGKTTIAEAVSRTVATLEQEAFTESEAAAVCTWLIENELVVERAALRHNSRRQGRGFKGLFNPFWMKIPLTNPDRILQTLANWFGWLHSWPILLLSILCWILAGTAVFLHGPGFTAPSQGVLAPTNWLWLGVGWFGLKLIHELSHGILCKRYGGDVPEVGVILVLFAPLFYVDTTSSWGFRSRWQRMHVAAAGMIAEFNVAALCVFWWFQTDSLFVAHILFTVVFIATVATVLFNANPLMRSDGYYLFSDFVNIPNLSFNGTQYLKGILSSWFLGTPRPNFAWQGVKGIIVRAFGVFAFLWRIVVLSGLIIAASFLFHGAGLLLAALACLAWVALPLAKGLQLLAQETLRNLRLGLRFAFSLAIGLGIGILVWDFIPWPGSRQAHGMIEYAPVSVVRAEVAGFVEEVLVETNQMVQKGEILARLRNDDLNSQCQDLEIQIEQSIIKTHKHLDKGEIALSQIEQQNREALEKRLAELDLRRNCLFVRAPMNGRVMARELAWLPHKYLNEGDPVLEIGDPDHKELKIAVSQRDISTFRKHLGAKIPIRLRSGNTIPGELTRLDPRAIDLPPHPALCAPRGGPLAVISKPHDAESETEKLAEPHFQGTLALSSETSHLVDAGQVGAALIREENDTLGRVGYRHIARWLYEQKLLFEDRPKRADSEVAF